MVLRHVLFWDPAPCLYFPRDLSDRIVLGEYGDINYESKKAFGTSWRKNTKLFEAWFKAMENESDSQKNDKSKTGEEDEAKSPVYVTTSLKHLLRFIRNTINHPIEQTPGEDKVDLHAYIMKCYPNLLLVVYNYFIGTTVQNHFPGANKVNPHSYNVGNYPDLLLVLQLVYVEKDRGDELAEDYMKKSGSNLSLQLILVYDCCCFFTLGMVLRHVLFWDPARCLYFPRDLSDRIVLGEYGDIDYESKKAFGTSWRKNTKLFEAWFKEMENKSDSQKKDKSKTGEEDEAKSPVYVTTSLKRLLRFIRKTINHPIEQTPGEDKVDLHAYIMKCYPNLLLVLQLVYVEKDRGDELAEDYMKQSGSNLPLQLILVYDCCCLFVPVEGFVFCLYKIRFVSRVYVIEHVARVARREDPQDII
nr:glutamine-tRNA ligase, putative / glutaminyl-tRNA synthetase, putative / GlnRS [Tanacetum cinerariifolium]